MHFPSEHANHSTCCANYDVASEALEGLYQPSEPGSMFFSLLGGEEYVVPQIPGLSSSMQHKDWSCTVFWLNLILTESTSFVLGCHSEPTDVHQYSVSNQDMINMSSCRFGNQNVRYLEVSLVDWRDCGSLKLLISGSLTKYMRLRSARSFASKATTLHCILDLASFKGIMSTQYELGCWINQTGWAWYLGVSWWYQSSLFFRRLNSWGYLEWISAWPLCWPSFSDDLKIWWNLIYITHKHIWS